jgi:phosphatidylserine/phosphatidylglycerophosphate/cardiolipin synthase-like enzyme
MFTAGHQVDLLQGAQEFFPALVQAMDRSVHEIRLETYIFSVEAGGAQVAQALERAAQRGVKVFVVMDGAGTEGCMAYLFPARSHGVSDSKPLAAFAPQAVRGRWSCGVLRRHQCAGRFL